MVFPEEFVLEAVAVMVYEFRIWMLGKKGNCLLKVFVLQ
jgi:hypothetical protein